MYQKAHGVIKTLAPLHIGATAGEETGNLNLIFRDQFTKTGIIPGSSIRGRMRADMRQELGEEEASFWYGDKAESEFSDNTSESRIKIEYASVLWLPVFCPGQPIVWVSSPRLLKRYQRIAGNSALKQIPTPPAGTTSTALKTLGKETLFFNYGFVTIEENKKKDLSCWFPSGKQLPAVVVEDDEIGIIHDMALYRQSRVRLEDDKKKVKGGQFFNVEALPEDTILVFPVGIKPSCRSWKPFSGNYQGGIYLGGLESIGFGHCEIEVKGEISMAFESYNLDRKAEELVSERLRLNPELESKKKREVLNEVQKMRLTASYGLERFWGEQIRLAEKREVVEKLKGDYWKKTWITLCEILEDAGVDDLPKETVTEKESEKISEITQKLWNFDQEKRKVALAVLLQLCDCMVWWTQRYKNLIPKDPSTDSESNDETASSPQS